MKLTLIMSTIVVTFALLLTCWGAVANERDRGATPQSTTAEVSSDDSGQDSTDVETDEPYKPKSKAELRHMLTLLQYKVTQNEETEPAFRNKYWDNKQEGVYQCIVCDNELFTSRTKFKSGTSWPSFYAPLNRDSVGFRADRKLFYVRTEVHCKRCGAHLGHVFDDGPHPTGKRYCMNSASLNFVEGFEDEESTEGEKSETPSAAVESD